MHSHNFLTPLCAMVIITTSARASPLVPSDGASKNGRAAPRLLPEDFIDLHNADPTSTWRAGKTPFSDMSVEDFRRMMGNNPIPTDPDVTPTLTERWPLQATWERLVSQNVSFPDWFDPRYRWHWCPTLSEIRDQGICGSCWAHGATEALSDRYCTMNNITVQLSATDTSFCCTACGAGCGGGDPEKALQYLNTTGAFTSTCHPYDQGDHRSHHPWPQPKGSQVCPKACEDGETLAKTKHFGTKPYNVPHNVTAIKLELLVNGPSGTQMTVYSDFGSYKSGVYWTSCGLAPPLGTKCQAWGHAVKILGWGHDMVNITTWDNVTNSTKHTLQDTEYWIGANSWSTDWGEGGFFRIMHNVVGFDSAIGAQHPLPSPSQLLPGSHGQRPSAEEQLRRAHELAARYQ